MMTDYAFIIFVSISSACISYFLDFAFGHPGVDNPEKINPRAILFGWTFFLAEKRLKTCGKVLEEIEEGFFGQQNYFPDNMCVIKEQTLRAYKIDIVAKGRELFKWEYATGMCIFCTNLWLSIFICILFLILNMNLAFLPNFFIFIVPFFSHIILRKID